MEITCVYGLTDASLMWYELVKKFVYENGSKSSITRPALFRWRHNNKFIGIITVHADDFCCAGKELFDQNVIYKLREIFSVGKEENCNFKYLGLNVE